VGCGPRLVHWCSVPRLKSVLGKVLTIALLRQIENDALLHRNQSDIRVGQFNRESCLERYTATPAVALKSARSPLCYTRFVFPSSTCVAGI